MADILKHSDELGNVLVQVQDDLRQLKRSLGRITFHEKGETVDLQALDTAIRRTESGIRRRAEQYQETVNRQVLTLPSIEDLENKTVQIPKWRPPLESIPDMHHQRGQSVGASPGEKHKAALAMRLLYNPVHPKNRTLMHQNYGIQLPDLRKRSATIPCDFEEKRFSLSTWLLCLSESSVI
ncbi:IQ motif-containing protein H [Salvelinus sp. IW2-2015]|uniref:IQ motif-containing protein H n=1 Tax=Salvelinus sp. IW2-2015 TaxID=2691554 RepID=UPI0038D49202